MKISVESLSAVKKKISVSVAESELLTEFDHAYRDLQRKANIPGFRLGKAPRTLLEKRFGPSVEADVYESLVRKTISQAIEEHSLEPVALPEIENPKRNQGDGFSYSASIEVKPTFEPKDYTGVEIKEEKGEVTDKQLGEVMERLQNEQAVLRDREGATHPLKKDYVVLAIRECNAAGTPSTSEEPKEQVYEFGGENLHPEIQASLKTLPVGESTVVKIAPKDLAEKYFHVTLRGIKEKILPALDDAFAKSVGPFENMEAFRTRVRSDLEKELEEKTKGENARKILDIVRKKNPIDCPEALVEGELHSLVHEFQHQMQQAGIRELPEEFSEETLRKKFREDAERRIHEQLVIESIAKKESIDVKELEVSERIGRMAKAARIPAGEFRSLYEKTGRLSTLRFQMLAQKTLDFLTSRANIK